MKKLTILIPKIKPPTEKDIITKQMVNILSKLKDYCDLNIVWVVFQPNKFDSYQFKDNQIIDFHNYGNAIEIIDEIKPDLIFYEVILGISGIAFSKAGKFKNIPIVTITTSGKTKSTNRLLAIKSSLRLIFSDKIIADVSDESPKKFGMIRYSLKRYFFLLRTITKINHSMIELIKFILFYPTVQIFSSSYVSIHKITSGNLNICCNQQYFERLKNAGFDSSSLILEGDPAFDDIFYKINRKINSNKNSKKIRILFCPTPMHEHGWMSKKEEEHLILDVINEISKYDDFELSLKIHPSTSSYSEYREIVNKSKFQIPLYQKEDTIELLKSYDIMLNYGSSNVILDGILSKKSVIMITTGITKEMDRLYDPNVMSRCNDIKKLRQIILNSRNLVISKKYLDNYIFEQIGKFDGQSSNRIAKKIYQTFFS